MANNAKVKMKVVALNPGGAGMEEVVNLEEVQDPDTSKSNVRSAGVAFKGKAAKMELVITGAAARGQFKANQAYVVTFAETT